MLAVSAATRLAIFLPVWVAIGLLVAYVLRRRGHDLVSWAVLGVAFGPFTIPLAVHHTRERRIRRSHLLATGSTGIGTIDLLVGYDGSPEAREVLDELVPAWGPSLRRLTIAMVANHEADRCAPNDPTFTACRQTLEEARAATREHAPTTLLLFGNPAEALADYAEQRGYDLIAVGRRGRHRARHLLGSTASGLMTRSTVPVIFPGCPSVGHQPSDLDNRPSARPASAASTARSAT